MEFLANLMRISAEERKAIAEYGEEVKGRPTELKTYIMESNNGTPEISSTNLIVKQYPTDLSQISILRLEYENRSAIFYMDATDQRFLVLYTNDLARTTDRLYDRLVRSTTNSLDKIWIPTEVLRQISQLSGNIFKGFGLKFSDLFASEEVYETPDELRVNASGPLSAEVLEDLSEEDKFKKFISYSQVRVFRGNGEGFVTDEVRYSGRLITKLGDSVDDHVSFVDIIRKIYRNLIEEIERNRIGIKNVNGRTLVDGQAFDLILDRQIDDLDRFVDTLLSPTRPFRLWGLKNKILRDLRQIVAVDLHTGDPIDLEITPSLIRIYLPKEACGNTVLRLYTNLQHSFDSAIRFNGEKLLLGQ